MRKPIVRIIGQNGTDLVPGWGSALTAVGFTDNDGGEADEINFTFAVEAPFPDSPAEGTRYRLFYGWEEGSLRDAGLFTYQSDSLAGDAESGWTMSIAARASDFIDVDKEADAESFDNMTAGEIFKKLARDAGKEAMVDPSIDQIRIPYRLRYNQSLSGFASELAEELGGTLKFAGGKMLITRRSAGTTASGREMPEILVDFPSVIGGEVSTEGRGRYAKVGHGYFDLDEGIPKISDTASIGSASRLLLLHPARSQAEAEYAAQSQADEQARDSVTGSLEIEGRVDAMAGARVKLSGFGKSRDAADLIAASISHSFSFDDGGGWTMSIELANRKTKKEEEEDDEE